MNKFSIAAFCLLIAGFFTANAQIQNKNFEIGKNIEIFIDVYKTVNANYVDDIDPGDFMKTGIDGLLKELDPYTVYIPEAEIEDFRIATTGQYGGIGALIHIDGDDVVVTDPYKDSPAKKAGVKAGDKIMSINGKSIKGLDLDEISQLMKGQAGGNVDMVVERYNEANPLKFSIVREVINIESVDYYNRLGDDIAYIKLDQFTQNAGANVKNAFIKMREEGKIKGLILDLRGNGGGLLGEAVEIVNLFVKAGVEVVSMKGQIPSSNQTFRTRNQPLDTELPVVVLVDEMSASSSEIVSGALQDLDRSVIMGQRTFGKGLVQNVLPLTYNSQIKITTAKYYIPSGRCIQAIDYGHKNEYGKWDKVPDSLISKFKTAGGRVVYDGAGIEPDVTTEPYTLNDITVALVGQHILFNYATHFYYQTPSIPAIDQFEITETIWNDFIGWVKKQDADYKTVDQVLLTPLQDYYKEEGEKNSSPKALSALKELENELVAKKIAAIEENKPEIKRILKMEILSRYYDYEDYIKFSVEFDPEIEQAKALLLDEKAYKAILKPAK